MITQHQRDEFDKNPSLANPNDEGYFDTPTAIPVESPNAADNFMQTCPGKHHTKWLPIGSSALSYLITLSNILA
eukprot:4376838-Ditylum_brightwellii.AAC.1